MQVQKMSREMTELMVWREWHAIITSVSRLRRHVMLRNLRHLRHYTCRYNTSASHHWSPRGERRRKGKCITICLERTKPFIVTQTNTGTVSNKGTTGGKRNKTPRDGVKRTIMCFPDARYHLELNEKRRKGSGYYADIGCRQFSWSC